MADADRGEQLETQNALLRIEVAAGRDEIVGLRALVDDLRARIADLEARLDKTSKNSSRPPSTDPNSVRAEAKKTRAQRRAEAREKSKQARKPGKQPGEQGRHLAQVAEPGHRVFHRAPSCHGCGSGLAAGEVVSTQCRQVFDLPQVAVEVTEHVTERVRCPCGAVTDATFPAEARSSACWGPKVRALGLYLTHRQHLPVERTAELMSDVLGAPVSTGFLAGLGVEGAGRLGGFVARLKELLGAEPVVHADETTIRVSATPWWLHVVASPTLTFLGCHPSRGRKAIDDLGVLPGFEGVVVHDGLSTYDYLHKALHAQCNAHLVRHLADACEHDDTKVWARLMTNTLLDAATAAQRAGDEGRAKIPATTAARFRARYRQALDVAFSSLPAGPLPKRRNTGGWLPHQRNSWNLAARFRDGEADILRFMSDTRVPFTNNDAERPLRPAKLHDKISGTFRNSAHAEAFATIRSYIQTAAKHDKNLLDVLVNLFTTGAWLPPDPAPT